MKLILLIFFKYKNKILNIINNIILLLFIYNIELFITKINFL
jgi:hypothetical protein